MAVIWEKIAFASDLDAHIADLEAEAFTVHLDPDAAEGEAMVMGGAGKYVATNIVTAAARLTSGKIPVATTNGRLIDLTAQAHEYAAKANYAAGELDTEAEIITAINATNTTLNSLIAKIQVLGLLEPPWWYVEGKTCVAAYQPKGAASYAASKVNLANPGTYDATDGAHCPAWSTEVGWTFDGANVEYLVISTLVPSGNAGSSLVCFNSASGTENAWIYGCYAYVTGYTYGYRRSNGYGSRAYYQEGGAFRLSGLATSGVHGFAGLTAYEDGDSVGSISDVDKADSNAHMNIGARHVETITDGDAPFSGVVTAIVFYSDTLSEAEVATVSAAMAAL